MYQVGITNYSNKRAEKEFLVEILTEMLGYLDSNIIKIGRISDGREKARRAREFQKLVSSVNDYNIDGWVMKHDTIRLLTMTANKSKKTIGVLAGYSRGNTFVVDTIYVNEDCRRLGAATTAFTTLLSEVRVSGCEYIVIEEPHKWLLEQMPQDIVELLTILGFMRINAGTGNCKWACVVKGV